MIHIIGDSHALTFQDSKKVECHWLGAATAYNLWKRHQQIRDIVEQNQKDEFWFCLGEIDCRIHIYNYSMKTGVAESVLIENTAFVYTQYIKAMFDQYKFEIMAAPPQGYQENFFDYDFYADRAHRQQITDMFNDALDYYMPLHRIVRLWSWTKELWSEEDFKEDKCHIKNEVAVSYLEKYLENR
jgi:hypothetical protein